MNKRLFALLVAAISSATPLMAGEDTVGGYTWSYDVDGDAASIDGVTPEPIGAITIPSMLGGKPVTGITDSAFSGCTNMTSVTIPAGVTNIGDSAFSGCTNMTSVTIPTGVTSIGDSAFFRCSGLTSVTIPASVTSIGDSAFRGCSGLAKDGFVIVNGILFDYVGPGGSVVIPAGVTRIGAGAFYGCSTLTNVTIPASVTSIGSSAFRGCVGLAEDGFVVVRNILFDYVGPGGDVVIPDGVESVGVRAFYGCSSLTNMAIPSSVKKIGASAFRACSSLASVVIPDGVEKVGESVFYGCSSLTNVAIPGSVTKIDSSAFRGCSSLTSVAIPGGVTKIGSSAFRDCSGLTSVAIPDGVTSVGSSAFSGCSGLTSLSIPASVTAIGSSAFSKCSGLESVTIPQRVCSSTMKKMFPAAYQSITNVVIADGVAEIGSSAFYGCSSLVSIAIPDSVTSVGDEVFYGCTNLIFDTTTLPGVKLVDGWAVGHTAALPKELDLTGVRGIGGSAFLGCGELVDVMIPAGVASIGDSAFSGCNGLTHVVIPASVTSIGEKAFYGCRGLMSIVFEGDVPSVGSEAFSSVGSGCTAFVAMDSAGWGVEIPGRWNGIAIAFSEDGVSYGGRLNVKFAKAQTVKGALIRCDKHNSLVGTVQVKVGKINARKNTAKLSAVATLLVNGKAKKFTTKAVTVTVDASERISPVTLSFMKPIGEMSFEMGANGFFTLESPSYAMVEATVGGALKGGARGTFRLEEFDLAVPGTLQDDLLPSEEPFDVVGGRWNFAQPATVKWMQDRETKEYGRVVDESRGKANRSGLKLNYAAKTGIFKGSFKVYSLQDAPGGKKKMKKLKVDVIGFVVDGVGTGEASCKRPAGGPWAVTIE